MANTSTHPWTVNGTRLDTWANNIESKKGWVHVPSQRGANAQVPGRHGEIPILGKKFDTGQFFLEMWVSHMNVDGGSATSDKYYNWRKNLDALIDLFDSSYALLDIRQTLGGGEVRQAFCEMKAFSDPEMFGNLYGKFKVSLDIPGVFWQDINYTEWTTPTGATAVGTHDLVGLAGGTAPMEDGQFVVDGPINQPKITDVRTGHWVQLMDNLATGDQWTLDTEQWTSRRGSNIEWTTNGANATINTVSQSDGLFAPRLIGIAQGNPPRIKLEGSGAGASTRMRGRHRRKFK